MENSPDLSAEEMAEKLKQLRMLVHASAVSLLILTGTVFVFLYRQVSNVRNSTRELVNYIGEYERSDASEFIAEAHRRFAEFRDQHPDFQPIYTRYFGTNPPPPRGSPATNGGKVEPMGSNTP